jgi:hypothetical protein
LAPRRDSIAVPVCGFAATRCERPHDAHRTEDVLEALAAYALNAQWSLKLEASYLY